MSYIIPENIYSFQSNKIRSSLFGYRSLNLSDLDLTVVVCSCIMMYHVSQCMADCHWVWHLKMHNLIWHRDVIWAVLPSADQTLGRGSVSAHYAAITHLSPDVTVPVNNDVGDALIDLVDHSNDLSTTVFPTPHRLWKPPTRSSTQVCLIPLCGLTNIKPLHPTPQSSSLQFFTLFPSPIYPRRQSSE